MIKYILLGLLTISLNMNAQEAPKQTNQSPNKPTVSGQQFCGQRGPQKRMQNRGKKQNRCTCICECCKQGKQMRNGMGPGPGNRGPRPDGMGPKRDGTGPGPGNRGPRPIVEQQ